MTVVPIITTPPERLKSCIFEAFRVAQFLERELVLHPPREPDVFERAWRRAAQQWNEAQLWTDAYVRAVLARRLEST